MAVIMQLTLTVAERQEIDFIGHRVPQVYDLLDILKNRTSEDWDADGDITLDIDQQSLYAIEVLSQEGGFDWIRNRSILNKLESLVAVVLLG
jgi:hypothetical protein